MTEDVANGEASDSPREAVDLADYLHDESTVLPPPLEVEQAVARIQQLFEESGGATFSLYFGDTNGKPFYAVSLYPDLGKSQDGLKISGGVLRQFIHDNFQLLRQDVRMRAGLWYDSELNKTFLDISAVITSQNHATRLAKRYNQISIYDLERRQEIDTGGTGEPPETEAWREETMDTPFEVTKSTGIATVAGISSGSPDNVTLVYYGSKGANRHFVQQIPVRDTAIFQHIQDEVKKRDRIQAVIVNEWHTSGCVTYLADFQKIPAADQETIVVNGSANLVQNGIKQIDIPFVQSTREKVRK